MTNMVILNETFILDAIQKIRNPFLDRFMVSISSLGNLSLVWISLIIVFLTTNKYRNQGKIIIISFILNIIVVNLIMKTAFARVRPYEANNFTDLLVIRLSDNSFPSGHSSFAFSFLTVILLLTKSKLLKIYTSILAIGIALSRLYLYVHYPTDVLVGSIVGILLALLAIKIYQSDKYKNIKEKYNLHRA